MFSIPNRHIYIVLLALYSFLNILLIDGDRLFVFEINKAYMFINLLVDVFLIWEANHLIQGWEGLRKPFSTIKINPLIVNFVYSLFFCLIISVISVFIALKLFSQPFENFNMNFKLAIGFTFRVNLFLHCVNAIVFYINRYSETKLEAVRLQKQYTEARFDVLKNQVNPHFLFNSFNVLSTLIYKNPEAAAEFIDQMSKVYRYVLKNQDEKLVTLNKELDFLEAYIYLLKIRFQKNLIVDLNIAEQSMNYCIAPATLQILLENAIKHNEISKSNPLSFKIYTIPEHNTIVVENNIQRKSDKYIDSTSIGLRNIAARYQFISNKEINITETEGHFVVKIPLLQIMEYESTNS